MWLHACGSIDGKLYFNLLFCYVSTKRHAVRPKNLGGKSKSRRNQFKHGGKSLLTVLPTLDLEKSNDCDSSPSDPILLCEGFQA